MRKSKALRRAMGMGVACAALALAGCMGEISGEVASEEAPSLLNTGDRQVFFGDLHLHTSYSLDAAAAKTNTTPDDAYMYAKGEQIDYLGRMIQRNAPLDFLAVTDHAEYLGNVRAAMAGEIPPPIDDEEEWQRLISHEGGDTMMEMFGMAVGGLRGEDTRSLTNPNRTYQAWQDIIASAERHNDPGKFTAFVAFEYSPTYGNEASAGHMHRNVIFRGPTYPAMPFAATDSLHHEALWAYAEDNRTNGIDSVMIPHNTNLSGGQAYSFLDTYGQPMSADYAARRKANEPLVEISQIKGTSETRPELSPDDEFADFELLESSGDLAGGYVRSGLARGMEISEALGINPFEQGFVGASDYHSGASSTEEDNYPGALGLSDDHANAAWIINDLSPVLRSPLANLSAAGITGVWAEENTRESIFAAFQRRETFATSGPRMRVRLFAGWGDPSSFANAADWATQAYQWGVPMGGNLSQPTDGAPGPSFLVQAAKDPASGHLDRIQIIKVWRDGGQSYERIYDVAWSGDRTPGEDGKLPAVGNTVDASTATWENSIGAAELFASWTDPDFDASQRAFYYARVIEIPTPRWATYLSVASGIPLTDQTVPWLQERAWTSPVYFTPAGAES